jgi:N6-adenosine-specific RNA methylase IME4
MKYKTILADPPWMEVGGGKIKRGADRHYPLMKTKDIIALPVADFAEDNAHLYLWVTNNFLQDGLEVMKAWGFNYKTMITWGKDKMGLGQYFRGMTEHMLFGVRGVLPYKIIDDKRQQGKTLFLAPRGEHSKKPEESYEMIEKVSYPAYLELFARDKRENWAVWGNQVDKDIEM